VFTDFLMEALEISRLQLSMAYAVGTIISALLIRFTSKELDILGARLVATFASLGLGAALFYLSQIDHLNRNMAGFLKIGSSTLLAVSLVTLGFVLLRFTGQGLMALSSRTMLMRWFVQKRGRMNSIMGIIISLVFSASPVAFEALIRQYGWRHAWMIIGTGMITICAGIIFTFYRNSPEKCGLHPDGINPADNSNSEVNEQNWTLSEAKKTRTFHAFNLGISFFAMYITAFTFHIVSIFKTAGLARHAAIRIFLPASVLAVIITIISGVLSDRKFFKNKLHWFLGILIIGLMGSGAGVLLMPAKIGIYLIIAGNGIGSGMMATLSSIVWPHFFGRKHLGEIAGYNMSTMVFFSAVGPPLFGWSYQQFGGYETSLWISLIFGSILFILSLRAAPPQK